MRFSERYDFSFAFENIETNLLWGEEQSNACYLEFFDAGDTNVFQIGDPFFRAYYTVFSPQNNTMGFGLSTHAPPETNPPEDNDPTAPDP